MSDGLFLTGKQIKTFDMVLPKHLEGPFLAPFREGGLTASPPYDAARHGIASAAEYCSVCENFPCLGGHPPAD